MNLAGELGNLDGRESPLPIRLIFVPMIEGAELIQLQGSSLDDLISSKAA
jgi:hypothetical protein